MKIHLCTYLLFGCQLLLAQSPNPNHCGQNHYYQQYLDAYPEAVQSRNELEAFTQSFSAGFQGNQKTASITIPVVFHINDPVNPYKVTMAQIQSALDILNEDFTASNADLANIRPEFVSLIANMDINFCLASLDPNGNPTTGVTYHYNDYNGREPDGYGSLVKSVIYWPGNKYLNIWIVNEVEDDGSLYNSGWAFLPDNNWAAMQVDGIVYNHRYLGYTGSSDVSGPGSWQAHMARVLTHEVGHYLNLHHTFYNYCNPPGDYVDDTPYVYYHGSNNCDQLGTFCSSTTVVQDQNYMDYTPCPSMFTLGQKARVWAALNSSVAGRNNLWSDANLIATGCQPPDNAGINSLELSITIYPNPGTGIFTISSSDEICLSEAGIYSLTGERIRTILFDANSQIYQIDIMDLPAGLYLVHVKSSHSEYYLKLNKL